MNGLDSWLKGFQERAAGSLGTGQGGLCSTPGQVRCSPSLVAAELGEADGPMGSQPKM